MNVSLSWLAQHIDLENLGISEISDMLTFAGIEVEGIQEQGVSTDLVVVAQVMEAVQHPDAERLKVTKVDTGDGNLHQIVCGAKNYKVGDKVPCALPGAVLPGNFEIKVGKLRGVESRGMLCSASELGMVDKEDGLMILDPELPLGKPIRDIFGNDTLIEVEITPNRPDLLSHWGMAVELAAITGRQLKQDPAPQPRPLAEAGNAVQLQTPSCPYYTATRIKGVTVKESPEWLQDALRSIGLRPINNVVDITNYVLHDLGHPLHAFDASKVSGDMIIRQATEGEHFRALDEKDYSLSPQDIVVSDESGTVLCIGGVMGGENSGVTDTTTDIILESAWFNSSSVRRTSRRLALSSDSSYRFERGTTLYGVERACALAVKMIEEICGGTAETTLYAGSNKQEKITVPFPMAALDQMAASAIPHEEAKAIMSRLGLKEDKDGWIIPAWRLDLHRTSDLLEEVVRVYGLDKIPSRFQSLFIEPTQLDKAYDFQMKLRQRLAGMGLYETQTIKLIAGQSIEGTVAQVKDSLTIKPLVPGDIIKVALPLSEDHSIMRPSLAPGLLSVAVRNSHRGVKSLRFFEIGRTFRNMGGGKAVDIETDSLGILMAGPLFETAWSRKDIPMTAAEDLLAVLEQLVPGGTIRLIPVKREGFAQVADIQINKKSIGIFARLDLARCRELDLPKAVFLAEIDLKKLQENTCSVSKVSDLPQFPGSSRDAALDVPSDVTNAMIEKAIESLKEPLLAEFLCFDIFTDPSGEKIAADRKSMAYTFLYRSLERTLKGEEVDATHQKVLDHLSKNIKGLAFRG